MPIKIRTMHFSRRFIKSVLVDLLLLSCLILLLIKFQTINQPKSFNVEQIYLCILNSLPGITFYYILSIFFSRSFSFFTISFIAFLLAYANIQKLTFTTEPLIWSDLHNWIFALQYLDLFHTIILVLGTILLLLYSVNSFNRLFFQKASLLKLALVACCFLLSWKTFIPHYGQLHYKNILPYLSGDWKANAEKNGLFIHLIQTGYRHIIQKPNKLTYIQYEALTKSQPQKMPQHIIYILCEACWNQKGVFDKLFEPLISEDFIALRGIAPTYGGGTANSEFEMLTTLPANGPLNGIIYQQYFDLISPSSKTIVSTLRSKGYKTIALHNYTKKFWKRDINLPKLGFDHFFDIEDMVKYKGPNSFPPDNILYEKALQEFITVKDQPAFFSLITMSTHFSYAKNNDLGENDYQQRLKLAILDMASFIKKVKQLDPEVLVMVYGDHKPALNEFFAQNHIIDIQNAKNRNVIGDVPVLIYSKNEALKYLVTQVDHKPFYCISAGIDQLILHSGSANAHYVYKHACTTKEMSFEERVKLVPSWVYYWSLFA